MDRPFWIDNAYWLYAYSKKHGASARDYKYLCKNSKDQRYKELQNDNWVVKQFSFSHFRSFIHADILCYSYDTAPFYFNSYGKFFKKILKPNTKLFFLSHGVSRWYLQTIDYKNTHFDTFISVWEREKDVLEKTMQQKNVVITWFPRFDVLHQNTKLSNMIVFLPAWRIDLSFGSKSDFKKSGYFKKIQSFLSSAELGKLLESYDTQLIWHPHQYIEDFLDLFTITNPRIQINIWKWKKSISWLFQNMWVFITDNTGAQFDVAYMKKPIIHYDFYPYHIKDQRLEEWSIWLFWDTFTDERGVLEKTEEYLKSWCIMEKKYTDTVERFFTFIDDKNCERVFSLLFKGNNESACE